MLGSNAAIVLVYVAAILSQHVDTTKHFCIDLAQGFTKIKLLQNYIYMYVFMVLSP